MKVISVFGLKQSLDGCVILAVFHLFCFICQDQTLETSFQFEVQIHIFHVSTSYHHIYRSLPISYGLIIDPYDDQSHFSRKSRKLGGSEKPFVKLRPAHSVTRVFSYVVKGIRQEPSMIRHGK